MDEGLESLSREQLIREVKRLRAGIREHRDASLRLARARSTRIPESLRARAGVTGFGGPPLPPSR